MLGGVTKGYPEVGGDHQPLSDLNGKRSQRVVPRQPIGDNLLGGSSTVGVSEIVPRGGGVVPRQSGTT